MQTSQDADYITPLAKREAQQKHFSYRLQSVASIDLHEAHTVLRQCSHLLLGFNMCVSLVVSGWSQLPHTVSASSRSQAQGTLMDQLTQASASVHGVVKFCSMPA